MTLVMAKYHHNIYPIASGDFVAARDFLSEYFSDFDSIFPLFHGDAFSIKDLCTILRSLPRNCTYLVRRTFDSSTKHTIYSVWIIAQYCSSCAIEYLFKNDVIMRHLCIRDVGYYDYFFHISQLPYDSHYIVQRYYE